jgi:hypothetical protein
MNKTKTKVDPKEAVYKLYQQLKALQRYTLVGFIVFVAAIYGYVLFRVNVLANQAPSQDAVSSQVQAAQIPHIDQAVVNQLKSLQDNSVNVQALFDQARNNPFSN